MKWIKISSDIHRKREVMLMARKLKLPREHVVGLLVRFWAWADEETEDGVITGMDMSFVDMEVGVEGFAVALASVGWVQETDAGLLVPNFVRHNGQSAKRRANDQRRKSEQRKKIRKAPNV